MEKIRIQFTKAELKSLNYHLEMEVDSLKDVFMDHNSRGEEGYDEAHIAYMELETCKKLLQKVQRAFNKIEK